MDEQFIKTVKALHGVRGEKWLNDIPSCIEYYEDKWKIRVHNPFSLHSNFVAPATKDDGSSVVLKMRFPHDSEFISEYTALTIFNGKGSVKVLASDPDAATMLLEHIQPGTSLKSLQNDEEKIAIFIEIIAQLHQPLIDASHLQTLSEWGSWFAKYRTDHGGTGQLSDDLCAKAEKIFLDEKGEQRYILHGDLYKDNVLLSERGWVAIDPRGVVGPREFEAARILKSPCYDANCQESREDIITRRLKHFSERLGFDEESMLRWAFAQSMLTAVWKIYDYQEVSAYELENAKLLIRFCS